MRRIDLTGPEGNAFSLMATARTWARQLGKDADTVVEEMRGAGSYEGLLAVFRREFGHLAELVDGDDR